jgi:hypothetical protein
MPCHDTVAAGTGPAASGTDVPRRKDRAFRVRGSGSDQLLILKPRTPFRSLMTDGLYLPHCPRGSRADDCCRSGRTPPILHFLR